MDRNSQKYLKRRKSLAEFCLPLGQLDISEKKLLKNAIMVVQELIIYKNQLFLGPTLTPILPIFREGEKSKFYMLKKVGLRLETRFLDWKQDFQIVNRILRLETEF